MNPQQFESMTGGRLVRVRSGSTAYHAFVPAPLPPQLQWSSRLVRALSDADRALGRLAGLGANLVNIDLLIGPFKRREAVLSSQIEGTQATVGDLVLFEAMPAIEERVPDVREVWNYSRALDYGLERVQTLPLSKRLIRELHAKLMEGVRGQERTPGEFRRSQNWIGPPGCTLAQATFVPPPISEMQDALDALERFFHEPSDHPALVRIAMIHYQFEAIHPFLDGNGRVGRLLIPLLMCSEHLLPQPLLYLSAFFESHRREYYDRLLAVSLRGEWEEWLAFFLQGVSTQAADAVTRAGALIDLRETYRRRFQKHRAASTVMRLVDALFARPSITVSQAAAALDVSWPTAQAAIDKLVRAKVIVEVTGQRRGRLYLAREIIRAAGGEYPRTE